MPIVSIIVPLYNKAPYVVKALDSVLAQTYTDYECIIVNDGSTDNSAVVVNQWISKNSHGCRFRLLTQINAGVSVARNRGISESNSEFVAFLDADDWWESNFLQEMVHLTETYPDAGIYGCNYWYVKNGLQRVVVKNCDTGYIPYFNKYAENKEMVLWTGAVMIDRRKMDDCRLKIVDCRFRIGEVFNSQLKLGEDFELWVRIASKYKVAFLNKTLAYYNQDVDVRFRGIGHLQNPQYHMLFNMPSLDELERTNVEYKQLIDILRVYGLKPYWTNREYHDACLPVLNKIDWTKQPQIERQWYDTPMWRLRMWRKIMSLASYLKQIMHKYKFL